MVGAILFALAVWAAAWLLWFCFVAVPVGLYRAFKDKQKEEDR